MPSGIKPIPDATLIQIYVANKLLGLILLIEELCNQITSIKLNLFHWNPQNLYAVSELIPDINDVPRWLLPCLLMSKEQKISSRRWVQIFPEINMQGIQIFLGLFKICWAYGIPWNGIWYLAICRRVLLFDNKGWWNVQIKSMSPPYRRIIPQAMKLWQRKREMLIYQISYISITYCSEPICIKGKTYSLYDSMAV